jgi:hypothetical protein
MAKRAPTTQAKGDAQGCATARGEVMERPQLPRAIRGISSKCRMRRSRRR